MNRFVRKQIYKPNTVRQLADIYTYIVLYTHLHTLSRTHYVAISYMQFLAKLSTWSSFSFISFSFFSLSPLIFNINKSSPVVHLQDVWIRLPKIPRPQRFLFFLSLSEHFSIRLVETSRAWLDAITVHAKPNSSCVFNVCGFVGVNCRRINLTLDSFVQTP